jgi:hypothetical protein
MSLGTGFCPVTIPQGKAVRCNLLDWAQYVLKELMNEANVQQNVLMGLVGDRPVQLSATELAAAASALAGTPNPSALAQVSASLGTKKLVTYQRITIGLTRERLDQLKLTDVDPDKVREMDAVDQIANMQRVGEAVAFEQVHMDRLVSFFKS